ncbi:hypothetical protein PanWU01x14_349190 [Parasponia andersonii]|uniref:Uncharacterized protein n=1 Tax=Parasponia andersonii TaxID=3476 RepID=A0A2P5ABD3_PARAD|nr:hypothetical protein PanWU01x14_349190 [Parasponia andersonii]
MEKEAGALGLCRQQATRFGLTKTTRVVAKSGKFGVCTCGLLASSTSDGGRTSGVVLRHGVEQVKLVACDKEWDGVPGGVAKDDELLALLRQLLEKDSLSATFIDHFTSEEGWERMKRRLSKVTSSAIMRMLANTAAPAILIYDLVLKCIEKSEKVKEMAQAYEDLKKTREDEKNTFESEKKQLYEALAKKKLEKERLEEKIK